MNEKGTNALPRALMCPYEWEDPAFRRSGRLPNLIYGDQVRAVWVTRYEYYDKQDISKIMERSAQAGFNTVFFQVRGNATVYYPSNLEPWSETYGWKSPGFDPLKHAIVEAHAHNMSLHAWVNVMPMWRGSHPPTNNGHMYWSHPEWSWYDRHGNRQEFSLAVSMATGISTCALCKPLNSGFYVSLNPCLPEARKHLVDVFREIVSSYEIDGLHLDYIRFPNEKPVVNGKEFSHDKKTLELFGQNTGSTPEKSPHLWDQWRCDCVTSLLHDIRRTAKSLRPQLVLTAAVGAERKQALSKFQDVEQWWKDRLLDAVVPMNYTDCQRTFRLRVDNEWQQDHMKRGSGLFPRKHLRGKTKRTGFFRNELIESTSKNDLMGWAHPPEPAVIMGTSLEFGDSQLHQKQISLALQRFGHFSVFCFSNLFNPAKQSTTPNHAMLLPFLKVLADASHFVSKSSRPLTRHPFRSLDIRAHPEEAFPYDQLHFYDHVPPELSFEPLEDEDSHLLTRRKSKSGRWMASASGDLVKGYRRTYRRNLQAKLQRREHSLDQVSRRRPLVETPIFRRSSLENKENREVDIPMRNWEVVKMSEATAQEENDELSSSNGGREINMHKNEVHFSSQRWFEMSMAHMKLKLVSGSRNQFNFRNRKSFGCISCAYWCSISTVDVANLVDSVRGIVKMMKCSVLKLLGSKLALNLMP
eukprot:Gb_36659 [translate_table: standard]